MSVVSRSEAVGNRDQLLTATEVALAMVTIAALVGMHRLFVDGSYFWPLVLQAVVAHTVVAVARRAGLGLGAAAAAAAVVGVLFISWTRFPETAHWLLPTGDTLSQASDDLQVAWTLFGDVRAPAPVENGFLAATAAAIWVLVYIADWAAFRASVAFEAALPATALFVFAAALGGPGSPAASAAVFSGAVLMHALLHRTSNQERSSRWAGGHRAHGRWSLVGTGATIIAVAVVAGAVTGPKLPGADSEAVVAWRDLSKDEPTLVVVSPIVQLQTRLVEQPDVEFFNVRSPRPSYWRLTSLDEFDGEIWRSSYTTDDADGPLPRALDTAASAETVTQEINIEALKSVWLPAAFEPVTIDVGDQPTDYDKESSTLMVDREVATSDDYSYTVTSQLADWSAAELRNASTEIPEDVAATYLQMPDDFPERATTLALNLTARATTPYDEALAIQDFLRSDEFTYSTDVGPGHSENALLDFLFTTRTGYCEQFSASFAALARKAGLPARVAIGFTWGINDRYDPTRYSVRGRHAHAWPEVYLGQYGWVPFEPTPGRGMPRADNWLGIQTGQDTGSGGAADPEGETATGPAQDENPGSVGGSADDLRPTAEDLLGGGAVTDASGAGDRSGLPEPVRDAALPLAIAVLAYLAVVPLAIAGQRLVRRRRASNPADRARYMWRELVDQAQAAGTRLPEYLTIAEKSARLVESMPAHGPTIRSLAHTLEAVNYGEEPPSQADVDGARAAWAATVAASRRRRSLWTRLVSWFDARRLVGDRRARLVANDGVLVDVPG